MVARDGDSLRFALTPDTIPPTVIPASMRDAPKGSIVEVNPAATELVRRIARAGSPNTGGVALIIDYGHTETAVGDTLQAMKRQRFRGSAGRTRRSRLDGPCRFRARSTAAAREAGGPRVRSAAAGRLFSKRSGIQRARRSAEARQAPRMQPTSTSAVERLTSPTQMGTLFKALAVFEGTHAFASRIRMRSHAQTPQSRRIELASASRMASSDATGGVSTGLYASLNCGPGSSDERASVMENRARATAALSPDATLVTLYQIHSAQAVTRHRALGDRRQPEGRCLRDRQERHRARHPDRRLRADPARRPRRACHRRRACRMGRRARGRHRVGRGGDGATRRAGANGSRPRSDLASAEPSYEVGPGVQAALPRRRSRQRDGSSNRRQRAGPLAVRSAGLCRAPPAAKWHRRGGDHCPRAPMRARRISSPIRRTTHRKEPDYGRQLSAIMLTRLEAAERRGLGVASCL